MSQLAEKEDKQEKQTPGYMYNFQVDLGNGTAFVVSGNFPKEASAEVMSAELDKIRKVTNRQQAKSALIAAEQEVEMLKGRVKDAKKDLLALDERNAAKTHIRKEDEQARIQAVAHIERMEDDIKNRENFVLKLRKEAE